MILDKYCCLNIKSFFKKKKNTIEKKNIQEDTSFNDFREKLSKIINEFSENYNRYYKEIVENEEDASFDYYIEDDENIKSLNEIFNALTKFLELKKKIFNKNIIEYSIIEEIEKINKVQVNGVFPLRLYDAKDKKLIENTKDKLYVTISHRWTEDDINIHNLNKYKKLEKLHNIYNEYNHLRYFWIDTICINQNDIEEIKKEIPKMGDYYKNEIMTIILTKLNLTKQDIILFNFTTILLNSNTINVNIYEHNSVFLRYIYFLNFEDDWFERMWTYQESILSNNLCFYDNNLLLMYLVNNCYKEKKFDYDEHEKFCIQYESKPTGKPLFFYFLEMLNENKNSTVGEIMYYTRNRKCTKAQDKIYSILGLVDKRIKLQVDYNLELKKIFVYLFKELINIKDYSWLWLIVFINKPFYPSLNLPFSQNIIDFTDSQNIPLEINITKNILYLKTRLLDNLTYHSHEIRRIAGDFFNIYINFKSDIYPKDILGDNYVRICPFADNCGIIESIEKGHEIKDDFFENISVICLSGYSCIFMKDNVPIALGSLGFPEYRSYFEKIEQKEIEIDLNYLNTNIKIKQ